MPKWLPLQPGVLTGKLRRQSFVFTSGECATRSTPSHRSLLFALIQFRIARGDIPEATSD